MRIQRGQLCRVMAWQEARPKAGQTGPIHLPAVHAFRRQCSRHRFLGSPVMAGLVPAIHVFFCNDGVRVDARDKPGHDVE